LNIYFYTRKGPFRQALSREKWPEKQRKSAANF
jgi:hypothetical protein